jgi:hypothetical protein
VEVGREIELDRTLAVKLVADAGKPTLDEPGASGESQVGMASLRDLLPPVRSARELVTIDDRHVVEAVGKHSGGAEPGHAGAHDER